MPDDIPQHLAPEDMIRAGHPNATFEDLEGLSRQQLMDVATLCPVENVLPDECVPCRAYVMLTAGDSPEEESEEGKVIPELLDLVHQVEENYPPEPSASISITFAAKVKELSDLVDELLLGPPVPPRDVSLRELALLTVAANKWSNMTDSQIAQGFSLSDEQQEFKQDVDALIERMQIHG